MFLLGLFIHIIFLFSIFDIYFKSPIVTNVMPYQPQHEALADRLVLFVVDGLRGESFVNYTTMQFLRSIANSNGRWGISSTRMPTESRPGHVAVIAGFYEDPSAVLKGWKENPVDFDSVFNQSTYSWCWGAYDIVEIFTKGSIENHIFVNKFDPYDQTFSTEKNTTHLDNWVFAKVKEHFQNAKSNLALHKALRQKKILFFLHLLGTDTSGHTHKPKTDNFLTTVRFVDKGIQEMQDLINDFYDNDGRTTFLMTSDHGMTDWGSHGAGNDHETKTPYVIWGSGVQHAQSTKKDPETLEMSLDNRFDINQADLTPLMSTFLSIPVPVNSVGRVPLDIMNISLSNKAKAIYSNARQLAAQYDKKRQDIEHNALPFLFKPYEKFNKEKYEEVFSFLERKIKTDNKSSRDYEQIILLCEEIMELSLAGLDYYHNYYQRPLLILVTLSFLGWIIYLIKSLLEQKVNTQGSSSDFKKYLRPNKKQNQLMINIVFIILLSTTAGLVFVQSLPWQYYIYGTLPLFLGHSVCTAQNIWLQVANELKRTSNIYVILVEMFCYTVGSFALGMSFTHRWMLSIPLTGMALWPFFSSFSNHLTTPTLTAWTIGCMLLSLFSFLPVVGKDTCISLVIGAGSIWLLMLLLYTWKVLMPLYKNKEEPGKEILLSIFQAVLMGLSLQNIYVQSKRFDQGTPVSGFYQMTAWIIAGTSVFLPLTFSKRVVCRLLAIYTSILNFYLLLSVSHEGLFMVTLILSVACWFYIEFTLLNVGRGILEYKFGENSKDVMAYERSVSRQDFRRAFFFISYIVLAFFGTGNIASLNSFEVRWVTCFITSFKPFIITGLILLKTLSPFLAVACSFRAVQHVTKAPTGYLLIIVLIYSNLMGIQLLYNVRNYGSWLDIGTSISQFVIVQVITLFIVIINQLAKILTDINILVINRTLYKSIKKYV